MPSNLRSVVAQCYRLGGSRQTRNFSSSPGESKGAGKIVGLWLLRPVVGLGLGSYVAYRMFGGKAAEIEEYHTERLREYYELFEEYEKDLGC